MNGAVKGAKWGLLFVGSDWLLDHEDSLTGGNRCGPFAEQEEEGDVVVEDGDVVKFW